ncbi:PRA1 family protein 3 [Toxocara canis]|uniref:PRA1 family protein n=1 Tax=Toxocara canis TaxID=6265 RepID=A0A0B2UUG5_TOXCA|nr:PRA1 family protein 3 [Toxocara canis]
MEPTACFSDLDGSWNTSCKEMAQPQGTLDVNWKLSNDLEIPPMRSFNEFIAEKARFEMPPFRDLPRWNNRILSNLLYFQTNYFAITLVLVVLSSVLHASDTIIGLSAIALFGAAVTFSLSSHPSLAQARREHALATLGGFVIASYYFIYTIGSVIVVLFTLAVPLLFVMLHASVRLRNLKAKINHQLERVGLKKTPMARFLELIGVDLKTF